MDNYIRPKNQVNKEKRTIQLILTGDLPAASIIRGFYTTTIVNIITWNKAYSLFPETIIGRQTYPLARRYEDYHPDVIKKYTNRGWEVIVSLPQKPKFINKTKSLCTTGTRHIGDSYTWQISLDTTGIRPPPVPDFVIAHTHFRIHQYSRYFSIHTYPFISSVLKYEYSSPRGNNTFFKGFLTPLLKEAVAIESAKVRPLNRPSNKLLSHYFKDSSWINGNAPEGWKFWDDHIPAWYEEWKKSIAESKTSENSDGVSPLTSQAN